MHFRLCLLVTADSIFSGIATFAKLPWVQCLTKEKDVPFDIAFLGAPFVSPCRSLSYFPTSPTCRATVTPQFADGTARVLTPGRIPGRHTDQAHASDRRESARDHDVSRCTAGTTCRWRSIRFCPG
jgi:hypothetical protein